MNKDRKEIIQVWKKNTPFLYDLVITHALEWPRCNREIEIESKLSFYFQFDSAVATRGDET